MVFYVSRKETVFRFPVTPLESSSAGSPVRVDAHHSKKISARKPVEGTVVGIPLRMTDPWDERYIYLYMKTNKNYLGGGFGYF